MSQKFFLYSVVGQRIIGIGIKADEIIVGGIVGKHSFAFLSGTKVKVIPNYSFKTFILANAQAGVANSSDPFEINIAGLVMTYLLPIW